MRTIAISFLAVFAVAPCLAGDKKTPDLWYGNVTYSHTIDSSWSGENKQQRHTAKGSSHRNAHIWTYIHFCVGGPELLNHAKGQFGFEDKSVETLDNKEDYTVCTVKERNKYGHLRKKRVTPGNKKKTTETKSRMAIHDEEKTGYNEWGNYRVTWMPGDGALSFGVIMPFVDIVISDSITTEVNEHKACKVNNPPIPTRTESLKMGRRLSVAIKLDEPKMTFSGTEILKDISGEEAMKYRPNWERVPSQKIGGSYTEKEIQTWYVTSDACEYVKNEMKSVKTIQDIYNDVATGKKPPSTLSSTIARASAGSTFSPMQTQASTCKIIPAAVDSFRSLEDIRDRYYKCLPAVVFEANIIHEGVHQKSCAGPEKNDCSIVGTGKSGQQLISRCKNPSMYDDWTRDPVNLATEEISAYQAQYDHLEKWYEQNCPDGS